jgi:hypothetical protein
LEAVLSKNTLRPLGVKELIFFWGKWYFDLSTTSSPATLLTPARHHFW